MNEREIRGLAMQLAVQLPAEKKDAQQVVSVLADLIDGWLYCDLAGRSVADGEGPSVNNVIKFIGKPAVAPR